MGPVDRDRDGTRTGTFFFRKDGDGKIPNDGLLSSSAPASEVARYSLGLRVTGSLPGGGGTRCWSDTLSFD